MLDEGGLDCQTLPRMYASRVYVCVAACIACIPSLPGFPHAAHVAHHSKAPPVTQKQKTACLSMWQPVKIKMHACNDDVAPTGIAPVCNVLNPISWLAPYMLHAYIPKLIRTCRLRSAALCAARLASARSARSAASALAASSPLARADASSSDSLLRSALASRWDSATCTSNQHAQQTLDAVMSTLACNNTMDIFCIPQTNACEVHMHQLRL